MPLSDGRIALGAAGEARAAAHLARAGYRILARNARADGVEIDLVAARGDLVVFVEVKTRRHDGFGGGAAAVDFRKQVRLARGAAAWLREHRPRARRARLDVIACTYTAEGWRITHYENAFEAGP
ncbi:MAG TPA: YraN family protein [Myxococcota bacterium]|nr:YraN family protein [Myxococcota bacterium]